MRPIPHGEVARSLNLRETDMRRISRRHRDGPSRENHRILGLQFLRASMASTRSAAEPTVPMLRRPWMGPPLCGACPDDRKAIAHLATDLRASAFASRGQRS